MKTSSPSSDATTLTSPISDLDDDWDDYKELWYPTGETLMFLEAKEALQAAGYVVNLAKIGAGRSAWLFGLVRPKTMNRVRFRPHLRDLLWPLGVYVRDQNVVVQRFGQNLVVSMFWPVPVSGEGRRAAWE